MPPKVRLRAFCKPERDASASNKIMKNVLILLVEPREKLALKAMRIGQKQLLLFNNMQMNGPVFYNWVEPRKYEHPIEILW